MDHKPMNALVLSQLLFKTCQCDRHSREQHSFKGNMHIIIPCLKMPTSEQLPIVAYCGLQAPEMCSGLAAMGMLPFTRARVKSVGPMQWLLLPALLTPAA